MIDIISIAQTNKPATRQTPWRSRDRSFSISITIGVNVRHVMERSSLGSVAAGSRSEAESRASLSHGGSSDPC